MAALDIASITNLKRESNETADTIVLPTHATGDLFILIHGKERSASDEMSIDQGWTELMDLAEASAAQTHLFIAAKKMTSASETDPVITTVGAAERFGVIILRILAADWHGTDLPLVSTGSTGDDTNPDPDNLDASAWGSEEKLYIATFAKDRGGVTLSVTAWPLPDNQHEGPDVTSGVVSAISTDVLTASSLNPSAYTTADTDTWVGATIAVRGPAAAAAFTPELSIPRMPAWDVPFPIAI